MEDETRGPGSIIIVSQPSPTCVVHGGSRQAKQQGPGRKERKSPSLLTHPSLVLGQDGVHGSPGPHALCPSARACCKGREVTKPNHRYFFRPLISHPRFFCWKPGPCRSVTCADRLSLSRFWLVRHTRSPIDTRPLPPLPARGRTKRHTPLSLEDSPRWSIFAQNAWGKGSPASGCPSWGWGRNQPSSGLPRQTGQKSARKEASP